MASGATKTRVDHATEVEFLENKFLLGEEFARITSADQGDMTGIGNWIRGAQKQADWTIYGVHCHESGEEGEFHGSTRVSPPQFLEEFARWTIDQGCALFAGHGPHFLRGIEIYKNRPIFYSLGNFIFQNESVSAPSRRGLPALRTGLRPDTRRLPGHKVRGRDAGLRRRSSVLAKRCRRLQLCGGRPERGAALSDRHGSRTAHTATGTPDPVRGTYGTGNPDLASRSVQALRHRDFH